jgi:hypothetical protein
MIFRIQFTLLMPSNIILILMYNSAETLILIKGYFYHSNNHDNNIIRVTHKQLDRYAN